MEINEITEKVIGAMFKVSNTLGSGFLEKVYENASAIEVGKTGLQVVQQYPIEVRYDNIVVGNFFADLFVENLVLVELKTVKRLTDIHTAQCLNYLRATGLPICLLVNFYKPKVEIRRIIPYSSWQKRKS